MVVPQNLQGRHAYARNAAKFNGGVSPGILPAFREFGVPKVLGGIQRPDSLGSGFVLLLCEPGCLWKAGACVGYADVFGFW